MSDDRNNDPALRYCGIVFIGAGSSWCYAATPDEAATKAAKQAKNDWQRLYKFKRKQSFTVQVYDTLGHSGWYATGPGTVLSRDTRKPVPFHSTIKVTV